MNPDFNFMFFEHLHSLYILTYKAFVSSGAMSSKYVMSAYSLPGTVLGLWETSEVEIFKYLSLLELIF